MSSLSVYFFVFITLYLCYLVPACIILWTNVWQNLCILCHCVQNLNVNFYYLDVAAKDFISTHYSRVKQKSGCDSFMHFCFTAVSAKLHYTNTSYRHVVQHHQRTSSQVVDVVLHVRSRCPCNGVWAKHHQRTSCNKFTTSGRKFVTSQHLDLSRCWTVALRCGKFVVQQVVELLCARPLVVL